MKVHPDAVEQLRAYVTHSDVSPREAFRHMFHWYMAARAAHKANDYAELRDYNLKQLNDDIAVLSLRTQLKDV